jgi:hypothetical protein
MVNISTQNVLAERNDFQKGHGVSIVSGAFRFWMRSIWTEIYLCHACSCHEIEDRNARAGVGDLRLGAQHHDQGLGAARHQPRGARLG